jgi:hypothetical protein
MADTKFSLLRQRLGRLTSDNRVGTPDGEGTTTTFNVSALASFADNYFNAWHGRFYSGDHKGVNFEVDDFTSTTGRITFSPAVTGNIKASSRFEIYRDITPVDMDDFINIALSMVEDEALSDQVDETIQMVSSTYEYTIPPAFAYLDRIYEEQSTSGQYSASSNPLDYRWWRILPGSPPRIWLDSALFTPTNGRKLRLIGLASQAQLVDDDDLCSVDQAFVIYQAKALFHESKIRGPGADFEDHRTQAVIARTRADSERTRLQIGATGRRV